ncbi:MAG: DoxX family membrane protein [Desulfobacterales bacterium]|uniref:DoxX family membrane protein n=1 Tax=Candidatus Desulfatibia vada TaxID=2841696 RepID=A0A8J6TMU0_9BACT|nr:DoxX family membrane protein [Candidatus Desulfatibia vada]MBL6971201.1 DoxX family membrane protein [Desulfobacterales bacterium]
MNCSTEKKPAETKPWHLHRIFALLARLILGGIFIYASFDKILHPAAFAEAVYNYQVLPDGFINLTAIVLPWLELVLGSFLIIGFWLPGTVVMSNLLLMTFTGALLFNMARGLDIGCGCFSTTTESAINLWTVLRDTSFLIPAAYLFYVTFFPRNKPALNRSDDELL